MLAQNHITKLPEFDTPMLKHLDISSNVIKTLPNSLKNLQHLESMFAIIAAQQQHTQRRQNMNHFNLFWSNNRELGDNCLDCSSVAKLLDSTKVKYTCSSKTQNKCGDQQGNKHHYLLIALVVGAIALVVIVAVVLAIVLAHKKKRTGYRSVCIPNKQTNKQYHQITSMKQNMEHTSAHSNRLPAIRRTLHESKTKLKHQPNNRTKSHFSRCVVVSHCSSKFRCCCCCCCCMCWCWCTQHNWCLKILWISEHQCSLIIFHFVRTLLLLLLL